MRKRERESVCVCVCVCVSVRDYVCVYAWVCLIAYMQCGVCVGV